MQTNLADNIKITNTTKDDFHDILWLFEQVIKQQEQNGYKVWNDIDITVLEKDIANNMQYKITKGNEIICVFSIQISDPLIWCDRDNNNSVYLHRIVANPNFKGQKQFERVLNWAKQYVRQNNLQYVRMDTWADNEKIINYYKAYGFKFIENYKTSNASELPIQNRNLNVALLELDLTDHEITTNR